MVQFTDNIQLNQVYNGAYVLAKTGYEAIEYLFSDSGPNDITVNFFNITIY